MREEADKVIERGSDKVKNPALPGGAFKIIPLAQVFHSVPCDILYNAKRRRDGFYAHPFGCGNTIIQGFKRWCINLIEDGHETRPYSPGIDDFLPPFSRNIIGRIPCKYSA